MQAPDLYERMDALEKRVERIEDHTERFDQIDARFDRVDQKFVLQGQMLEELQAGQKRIESKVDAIIRHFDINAN